MIQATESKTSQPVRISKEDEEIARCRGSFEHFLFNYVKTNDTQRGLGESLFPDYPYLRKLAHDLQYERLNLIFKPRQMLVTWALNAKRVWKGNFHPYSEGAALSQGETYSKAFLDRCWFIQEHLPDFLKADAIKTATEINWTNIKSKIISLPCTKNAARSLSLSDVTMDEAGFFEWGSETYAAIAPTVDKYGSLDICSTSNGQDPLFYGLWNDPNSKFNKIDLKWNEHPFRDENWKKEIIAMIGLRRWLREYEKFWFAPLGKAVHEGYWNDLMEVPNCFDQWRDANIIIMGWDRGYHHPGVLWTFVNSLDQWVKAREFLGENITRDDFIKTVHERTNVMFPKKPVLHYVPPDFDAVESDGKDWLDIMKSYGMNVKVGRAGKDEVVRRTDAQRNFMKLRADKNFAMIVDPECKILLEGYKGGYCYPQTTANKSDSEKPQKDGWYDHLQDADAVIADNHDFLNEPLPKPKRKYQPTRYDEVTGRPLN